MSDTSPVPSQQNESALDQAPPPADPPRSMCSVCALTGCLFSALALLGVTVLAFIVIRNPCPHLEGRLPSFLYEPICGTGSTEVIVTPPSIYDIRALGQLETVEWNASTIVEIINGRGPGGRLDERLDYGVCARVVAGVDLAKLKESDIEIVSDTITITLPLAEIFRVDPSLALDIAPTEEAVLEDDTTEVRIESGCNKAHLWNTPPGYSRSPELIRVAQEEAMKQFRDMAGKGTVLDLAASNAEKELSRLLIFAGYKRVIFLERSGTSD